MLVFTDDACDSERSHVKVVLTGSECEHVFTDVLGEGVKVVGTRRYILVHRQRGDTAQTPSLTTIY